MKTWFAVVTFAVVPSLTWAGSYFMTGNDIHELWLASKRVDAAGAGKSSWPDIANQQRLLSYVEGVFDANDILRGCIPDGATAGQLASVVGNHLDRHPEQWQVPGAIIVVASLDESFHCIKWEKK